MSAALDDADGGGGARPRRSATSLLLTVLGEFVLPAGGDVWTSTLVRAAATLDITEKNARQAIARVADDGLIEPTRHGREVRWSLTTPGRRLLETGAERIYSFGEAGRPWDGRWLVVHCATPERRRQHRDRFRSRMAFLGVGELSPSLFVTPHVERESQVRATLSEFGRATSSIVFVAARVAPDERAEIVSSAWDLGGLGGEYERFLAGVAGSEPIGPTEQFRAVVELVHEWRRFPFADPELPPELLPADWPGHRTAAAFAARRAAWRPTAEAWFDELERR